MYDLVLEGVVLSEELRRAALGVTAPVNVPEAGLDGHRPAFGIIVAKARRSYAFSRIDKCRFCRKDSSGAYEATLRFWLKGNYYVGQASAPSKEEALFEAIKKAVGLSSLKLLHLENLSLIAENRKKKVIIVEIGNGQEIRKTAAVAEDDDVKALFEALADGAGCFLS